MKKCIRGGSDRPMSFYKRRSGLLSAFLLSVRTQNGLIAGLLRIVCRKRGNQPGLLVGARRRHGTAHHALPSHEFQLSHVFHPCPIVRAECRRYSFTEAKDAHAG